MEIWPAIDLRGGQCVRLIQGQYDRQITYGQDPASQARTFEDNGAEHLHVVDLDGAKSGKSENLDAIRAIREAVKMQIEVGGGIRDEESICMMLDLGIDRVILGTSAIRDFGWFGQMAVRYPEKLVLGLDARGAQAAEQGWTQESGLAVLDLATRAAKFPIAAIVYTDITKDGMMTGPNFDRTGDLAAAVKIPVIASGGVTTVEDIRKLVPLGVAGAIIGRALYEGKILLADALAAAK
jgi:phosphoribosylformimino-5-aminoimidazole carboxamide ribotide isomerase